MQKSDGSQSEAFSHRPLKGSLITEGIPNLVPSQGSIYGRRDHCHSEYDQKHSEPELSKIL